NKSTRKTGCRARRRAGTSPAVFAPAARGSGVTPPMCGIIGYIGAKQVVPVLIDGLRRLEYRGYDSAGVAVVRNGEIELRRSAGKLARLEEVIATTPLAG